MNTLESGTGAAGTENPYLSARREWNERYGDYIARARNWRSAAFAALAISAVLALGVVWEAAQSKVVPYVVEVDKLGDAIAVARADAGDVFGLEIALAKLGLDFRQQVQQIEPSPRSRRIGE